MTPTPPPLTPHSPTINLHLQIQIQNNNIIKDDRNKRAMTTTPSPTPSLTYSKTCVKRPLSKRQKMVFKTNYRLKLSLNAGQKYCRMLQGEHSAILSTFIKLPFVIKYFCVAILQRFYCTNNLHLQIQIQTNNITIGNRNQRAMTPPLSHPHLQTIYISRFKSKLTILQ